MSGNDDEAFEEQARRAEHKVDAWPTKFWVFDLTWLVLPLLFFLGYGWAYDKYGPEFADGDINLMAFETLLFFLVVAFTFAVNKTHFVGWVRPKGISWLWVAGPLWLGVISPLGLAAENIAAMPSKLVIWFAISLFVAVNEETLFRGFILRGLLRSFHPITAVILSSIAFGMMHILNLGAGAEPLFVAGMIVSATGTGAIMAAMTIRTGSIVPAMLFHLAADVVGLAALGGYEEGISKIEYVPSMVIIGIVFFVWGLFWSWRAVKSGKVHF